MATATKKRSRRRAKRTTRGELPAALRELAGSFGEHKLMVWTSALSFQILTAIVPFLLFGLGLIGFVSLDNVWTDIAKSIRPHMSGAAFTVVNSTANKVLHQKQVFWVSAGLLLALWQVSGGVRVIMGGLTQIYD